MHIRKDDIVEIITGDDKGKRGRVLSVDRKKGKLVVEGRHAFDMRDFGIAPPKFFWLWIEPEVKVGVRIVANQVSIEQS